MRTKRSIDTELPYCLSIFSYQDPLIKKSIHSIKYFHRKDLLLPLTYKLAEEMLAQSYRGTLVPIPMPKIRRYIRGYNQAEQIASILSDLSNLPQARLLTRKSAPTRQVKMRTRAARLLNQKKSFSVTKSVHGLDIILVDDVTTTGATLQEARKVLLNNGARSVRAVTLAH